MSGFVANPVINRTGSVPGATQGPIANRPAAGIAPGDWYLALDEQIQYEWTGAAWVVALDGSGTAAQNLQQVTDIGNTTTNLLQVKEGATTYYTEVQVGAIAIRQRLAPLNQIIIVPDTSVDMITGTRIQTVPNVGGMLQNSNNNLRLPIRKVTASLSSVGRRDYTILLDSVSIGPGGVIFLDRSLAGIIVGMVWNIKNIGGVAGNDCDVFPAAGAKLNGVAAAFTLVSATLDSINVQFDGTDYWIL